MTFDQIDLSEAERVFAVANTPLFLLRKLRADRGVQDIHANFTGPQILKALKSAIRKKPTTLDAATRPYAYLVALSMNTEVSYLKQAAELSVPHFDWFEYIANVLVKTRRPTSMQTITVAPEIVSPSLSHKSTAPVKRSTIKLDA